MSINIQNWRKVTTNHRIRVYQPIIAENKVKRAREQIFSRTKILSIYIVEKLPLNFEPFDDFLMPIDQTCGFHVLARTNFKFYFFLFFRNLWQPCQADGTGQASPSLYLWVQIFNELFLTNKRSCQWKIALFLTVNIVRPFRSYNLGNLDNLITFMFGFNTNYFQVDFVLLTNTSARLGY